MAVNRRVALLLTAAALLFSCGKSPGDPVTPETPKEGSGPPTAQIMHDLVGRSFLYFVGGTSRNTHDDRMVGVWTVGEGELEDFVILQRFPRLKRTYGDRTDEIHALVTLAGGDQRIRGALAFQYVKQEKGWDLYLLGPRDGDRYHDFSFERIRTTDGKVTAAMAPANPPAGPWRFAPKITRESVPSLRDPQIQLP